MTQKKIFIALLIDDKNIFTNIDTINNINYSNYFINEDGDIKNIKGRLLKQLKEMKNMLKKNEEIQGIITYCV